jgi:hypothetical protein
MADDRHDSNGSERKITLMIADESTSHIPFDADNLACGVTLHNKPDGTGPGLQM